MHSSRSSFNGAASNCSRKPSVRQLDPEQHAASMGPRATARGNHKISYPKERKITLQWGREQLLAETRQGAEQIHGITRASMGPRATARGNSQNSVGLGMQQNASM